jgi:hypothetical protein
VQKYNNVLLEVWLVLAWQRLERPSALLAPLSRYTVHALRIKEGTGQVVFLSILKALSSEMDQA